MKRGIITVIIIAAAGFGIWKVLENNKAKFIFEEPQRAITPGQSLVFYIEDVVIGGGKIV